MAEVESKTQAQPESPVTKPRQGPAKKRKKKIFKTIITLIIIAGILGAGGYALYKFLNSGEKEVGEIFPGVAEIGSITTSASGRGSVRAKETAAITLTAGGTVKEVLVSAGEMVYQGQPLYTIDSQAALDAVTAAQDTVTAARQEVANAQQELNNLNEELARLRGQTRDLTITAPFSGKLMDIQKEYQTDERVNAGEVIATLVNDRTLKLSLYFSYGYEQDIHVGQRAGVSIPQVMTLTEGRVEKINKVNYVTQEGGICFEAIIAFENTGNLTAGMAASAILTDAAGNEIYSYEPGTVDYYERRTITAKVAGPVLRTGTLLNYANIEAGEALLYLGTELVDEEIRLQQAKITTATQKITEAEQKVEEAKLKVEEAERALGNFDAVAPIDGTIITCTLTEGAEVRAGDTVIIISNTTTMMMDITVDDRNISFIHPGDIINLTWNGGMSFQGRITAIDMGGAQQGSGITRYPVKLEVENWGGSLWDGAWLDYSFITSQSDECVLVPSSSVRFFSDADGNRCSVVFVQRDTRPDDVPELQYPTLYEWQERDYPTEEEGYYPVLVETGLATNQVTEIISGVEAGDVVFVNYTVQSGAWG